MQFHEGLGSLHDKTLRMSKLSTHYCTLFAIKPKLAEKTALISKADLVSEMVGEFPELQGIMGGYYSKLRGMPNEVSKAISEHYKPKGVSDELPKTKLGLLLSIIDKIDTLTGFFIINKHPTGSKDPFALRRTGLAIAQILIKQNLNASIDYIVIHSLNSYNNDSELVRTNLSEFLIDKIRFILKNENLSIDIINSVLDIKDICFLPIPIILERINLLESIRNTDDFKLFLINVKRLHNILKNVSLNKHFNCKVDQRIFDKIEEREIFDRNQILLNNFKKYHLDIENQSTIMNELFKLNNSINLFFENVIVNHKDEKIRLNRVSLLTDLYYKIIKFSQFSIISD